VAVEFEFLHDVLQALQIVKAQGADLSITIKVRDNGYRSQYEAFVQEYFPGLVELIADRVPIRSILERSDFYISIYSQTLFEASCLGIPCLYYKKDDEILFAPFDGRSELVTVSTTQDLVTAVTDFLAGHDRFDAFLQREVMEKYIGPLDGGNVERNLNQIYGLLQQPAPGAAAC
jgi:CDP-glycerol glycerophosphotransferase (TagB/SpsB family)